MRSVNFFMCLFMLVAGLIVNAEEIKKNEDVPTRDDVFDYLQKCEGTIITGKDERGGNLTPQHYMAYAMTVHSWLKSPDELELTTRIERKWFVKVHEKLDEMWFNSRQSDLDGTDENSKKDAESGKNFDKTVKEFSALLKTPAELTPAKLNSLRKSKDSKCRKDKKKTDVEAVAKS